MIIYDRRDIVFTIQILISDKTDRNRYEKMVKYCVREYASPRKCSKSDEKKPIKKRICVACSSVGLDDVETEPTSKKRRLREGNLKHDDETNDEMSDDDFENDDLDENLTMEM